MIEKLTVEESPIEKLLKEQQSLQTPVGTFSEKMEKIDQEPDQAIYYKQLIPLSKPALGEQYAFEVDLDRCTSCKACVSACHSLNGLEENETWRDVGSIIGNDKSGSYSQTVTTACHHCVDPGCLNGCPVNAYEKDVSTGIVHHLDDQCIGCQYCVLKCPYDVPKYSKELGIVRKCDMCHSRLADGEAPACVQGCPTQAIKITSVAIRDVNDRAENGIFLPGSPSPDYTIPATVYKTKKSIPKNAVAADSGNNEVQPSHSPLVYMLVLTQIAAGYFCADFMWGGQNVGRWVAFCILLSGVGASILHLGRPMGAWRFFLGLSHSWLSREILAFSIFIILAAIHTLNEGIGLKVQFLAFLCGLSGVWAVFTSVMIYHDTNRPFWRFKWTLAKFAGTTMGLGFLLFHILSKIESDTILYLSLGVLVLKAGVEAVQYFGNTTNTLNGSVHIHILKEKPLKALSRYRYSLLVAGVITGMVSESVLFFMASFAMIAVGEVIERKLFFKGVVAPKMPGGSPL